ncbi:MAG: flagellar biosynthetic protein FliO [Nitrospira sp.]|nr:flagellar biosynthetic protein FliO [Nitrospira sp.]MDH4302504.1 flagellar biosynthetic protein FliO [Nitrospira sp.]MDH5192348.1 flagellar biosynthetic protein FliO [Nitrospira sp.]
MIDVWDSLLRTVAALAVVLLCIGLAAFVARRVMGPRVGNAGGQPLVQVLASGYLAPRKTISLVEVAGEYLIVGATATDLIPLGRISDTTRLRELLRRPAEKPSAEKTRLPGADVAAWLQRQPLHWTDHDKEHHGH